ncbi:hypothetical protein GQR58_013974 [Nymphon striatum]|nr:hypothetical protein GQR58_013974 [Nymphon striatum]
MGYLVTLGSWKGEHSRNTVRLTETFVCKLYGVPEVVCFNESRLIIFKKLKSTVVLPPTKNAIFSYSAVTFSRTDIKTHQVLPPAIIWDRRKTRIDGPYDVTMTKQVNGVKNEWSLSIDVAFIECVPTFRPKALLYQSYAPTRVQNTLSPIRLSSLSYLLAIQCGTEFSDLLQLLKDQKIRLHIESKDEVLLKLGRKLRSSKEYQLNNYSKIVEKLNDSLTVCLTDSTKFKKFVNLKDVTEMHSSDGIQIPLHIDCVHPQFIFLQNRITCMDYLLRQRFVLLFNQILNIENLVLIRNQNFNSLKKLRQTAPLVEPSYQQQHYVKRAFFFSRSSPLECITSNSLRTIHLLKTFKTQLRVEDVYLIFDRYYYYSTNSVTRGSRATGVSRAHHLQVNSKLPAQKILLTSSKNKKQLMQLIVDDFVHDKKFHEDNTQHHKLVVTGADPVPIEISEGGVVISRADLSTSHEEADNVIIQQVLSCAAENAESKITVVADDTDVFVLLLHYPHMSNLKNVVLMESPIKGRAVLDIGKTVQKHCQIVEGILPAHTLSGCDTVASYFKIGKATVLKTLRSGHSLNLLGAPGHSMESVIQQATSFISACYGQTDCSTMPETRLKVWLSQTGKGSSTPKLCTLPPTTEAFKENFKRAHYQALVWRSLEAQNPPELDSTEYGWVKDDQNKSFQPVTIPDNVELAPQMRQKSPSYNEQVGSYVKMNDHNRLPPPYGKYKLSLWYKHRPVRFVLVRPLIDNMAVETSVIGDINLLVTLVVVTLVSCL